MNDLYLKYFANVRWTELILAFGVAVLGDLQLSVQGGGKVTQEAILKALGVGAGVAWAYLRIPKVATPGDTAPPVVADNSGAVVPDTHPDVVTEVIESVLPTMLKAAAPDLAKNITAELGRTLKHLRIRL